MALNISSKKKKDGGSSHKRTGSESRLPRISSRTLSPPENPAHNQLNEESSPQKHIENHENKFNRSYPSITEKSEKKRPVSISVSSSLTEIIRKRSHTQRRSSLDELEESNKKIGFNEQHNDHNNEKKER